MAEREKLNSIAGRIATILAVLTLVITALNSIPPFMALRGKEPYVVYTVGGSQMLYPQDADRAAIRRLLQEESIPDAFATLSLSNRGDVAAQDVIITARVPGRIIADETDPASASRPAWVHISKEPDAESSSSIRYNLRNLGLLRTLEIKVSYISASSGEAGWDIFYDGRPGEFVPNLDDVPDNARAISFISSLKILGVGLLLSLVAYIAIKFRENIRRHPFVRAARSVSASPAWRKYKNSLIAELSRSDGVTLYSTADGQIDASDPKEFWDAIFEINGKRFAAEVHTKAQKWLGIEGDSDDQLAYALKVSAMANSIEIDLSCVYFVYDVDVWSGPKGEAFESVFSGLSQVSRYELIYGSPKEAAKRVIQLSRKSAA